MSLSNLSTNNSGTRLSGSRPRPLSSSSASSSSGSPTPLRRTRYPPSRHSLSASMSHIAAAAEPSTMLSVHGRGLGASSSTDELTSPCSKCGSIPSPSRGSRRMSEPVLPPMDSSSGSTLLWQSMAALSLNGNSPSSSALTLVEDDDTPSISAPTTLPHPQRPTQLVDLPTELLYSILAFLVPDTIISKCTWDLPSAATPPSSPSPLLAARATCRLLSTISLHLLRPILARDLSLLTLATSHARAHAHKVEADAQPALAHNRRFLRTLSTAHLRELASLARPPAEIHLVASALVHLVYAPEDARMYTTDWKMTRRALARAEVKAWVAQVHARGPGNVHEEGLAAARAVIAGMGITYERMKSVSVAGYRMLIVVAAAMQFCEHASRVERAVGEYVRVGRRLEEVGRVWEVIVRETQGGDSVGNVDEEEEVEEDGVDQEMMLALALEG